MEIAKTFKSRNSRTWLVGSSSAPESDAQGFESCPGKVDVYKNAWHSTRTIIFDHLSTGGTTMQLLELNRPIV